MLFMHLPAVGGFSIKLTAITEVLIKNHTAHICWKSGQPKPSVIMYGIRVVTKLGLDACALSELPLLPSSHLPISERYLEFTRFIMACNHLPNLFFILFSTMTLPPLLGWKREMDLNLALISELFSKYWIPLAPTKGLFCSCSLW